MGLASMHAELGTTEMKLALLDAMVCAIVRYSKNRRSSAVYSATLPNNFIFRSIRYNKTRQCRLSPNLGLI